MLICIFSHLTGQVFQQKQPVYLGSIVGRREFCLQPDGLGMGFHSIIYLVN